MTRHPRSRYDATRLTLAGLMVIFSAACSTTPGKHTTDYSTLTGIDVLTRDGFTPLADQRVGLITNHTGLSREGVDTLTLFHRSEHVNLVAIFSPEHGFAGKLDEDNIADGKDPATGLPIYSLYGQTRRPTAQMLAQVDTLVFDIQDIGTRFYTYLSTMGEAMVAAAEHGKRFVVLDRPNPLGGVAIEGPMLDADKQSFVGWHSLPVRHGMTVGELALMIKAERGLELELDIIRCENWRREQDWAKTSLTWVNPSPNMRSVTQALLYPGIGLLETTNVSVGRGTDSPFEVFGAPWINPRQLAYELNALGLKGVAFVPIRFTPESSTFAGELCGGVNVVITNQQDYTPVATGLAIAATLRQVYPDHWRHERYLRLLGSAAVQARLDATDNWRSVVSSASAGVDAFQKRRERFLLYE